MMNCSTTKPENLKTTKYVGPGLQDQVPQPRWVKQRPHLTSYARPPSNHCWSATPSAWVVHCISKSPTNVGRPAGHFGSHLSNEWPMKHTFVPCPCEPGKSLDTKKPSGLQPFPCGLAAGAVRPGLAEEEMRTALPRLPGSIDVTIYPNIQVWTSQFLEHSSKIQFLFRSILW